MAPSTLVTALAAVLLSVTLTEGAMRRVCYHTNWSQYRPGAGRFVPENVDPTLCTHYMYAFATLQGNNVKAFEWNDESQTWSKGMYERFTDLKRKNPSMKISLAIGGWNMGSGPFTSMVATQQSRAQFIQSATSFLRKHGFDGLDVDWEYPANRGSPAADRDHFTALMKELRASFEQEAATSGMDRLLLTAAVAAGKDKIDTAYDIPQINKYLDFFNLMTYDLHGSWESYTGHHSPLFPRAGETGDDRYLNMATAAQYWVQKGASPDKLVVGMASYGRSFTLTNPTQNGIGASASRAGQAGQYTRENGFLAFYEVCQMINNGGQIHDDAEQHVRYVTHGDQWVGVEDEKSITEKVCYIKQQGYGGVMIWALDEDDFSGSICGRGPYPLLHAINREVNNPSFNNCPNSVSQPVTSQPITYQPVTYPPITNQPITYRPITYQPITYQPVVTAQPQTHAPVTYPPQPASTFPPYPGVHGGQILLSTVAPSNPKDFSCIHLLSDFYPSPNSCDEYYICANQVSYRVRCAVGLYYNPLSKHCDWPSNVHCVNARPSGQQPSRVTPQVYTLPSIRTNQPLVYSTQPPPVYTTRPPVHPTQPPVVYTTRPPFVYTARPPVQTQPPQVITTAPPVPHFATTAPPQPNLMVSASTFCANKADGVYRNPSNCNQYFECLLHLGFVNHCPHGLVFNEAIGSCQHPFNTPECASYRDSTI